MKLSFVLGAAAGYVLGTRAGRQRYEQIVAASRRVAGSQTVQSSAGVFRAQADDLLGKGRHALGQRLTGR